MEINYFCRVEPQEIINRASQLGEAIPITETFNPVLWCLILVNIMIFAFVRTVNPGYLRVLFSTAINNRQLVNNIREDLNLMRLSAILLNLTYFNALAIILWKAMDSKANVFILILAALLLFLALLKLIVIRVIAFLLNSKSALQEHILNHLIYFQIAGIILTPILLFTHYVPERYVNLTLTILLSLTGLFLVLREFQSLIRALQYKISIFYIILYLCTLELLPLAVGIRVFILKQ